MGKQTIPYLVLLAVGGCGPLEWAPRSASDDIVIGEGADRAVSSAFSAQRNLVYLNFDGATLKKVDAYTTDAPANTTVIGSGTLPPFGGGAQDRDQVVAVVHELFAAYDVELTLTRPASGDYTMVVIGGRPEHLGQPATAAVGLGNLDCGNKTRRDVAVVWSENFPPSTQAFYLSSLATTIAHELGHNLGLPHATEACDVMSYGACQALPKKVFLDKSSSIPAGEPAGWSCGLQTTNSHQLLLANVGSRPVVDTTPPRVSILAPQDQASVGQAVLVRASATDETAVVRVEVLVDGAPSQSAVAAPFDFNLSLSPGAHALSVLALDAAGNRGEARVTVTVQGATPPPSPSAPASPPAGDELDPDPTAGAGTLAGGCAVGRQRPTATPALLSLLLGLALRRRGVR